ncbi:MAG: cadherin-like domain-containing protein, partial [Desulfuromonadales bacterium]|nr:cadherin-like domain-containing protein [Desulfuromonadales bacterium]
MADDPKVTVQAEAGAETTTQDAANLNALIVDDFAALVYLEVPEAGQTQEVLLAVGDIVRMNFDINGQTLILDGEDLRIEFDNGAVIVLDNFATLVDEGFAPLLTMPDGAMIPGDILVSALTDLSIEAAAGEAAASGGSGEYRADMGAVLDGINKLGVQDPDPFAAEVQQVQEDEQTPVNNGPVANDDIYDPDAEDDPFTTPEDTPLVIDTDAILANDTDVEDGTPEFNQIINGPSHGQLEDNGDGTFTYTPDPDYNGEDSFVYEVIDSDGATAQAEVTINVTPINDPPVAEDDQYETDEDTPLVVEGNVLDSLLENDSDIDGDDLTVNTTPVTGPENGELVLNEDGTFTYTPNENFNGEDSFEYEVTDGQGGSDTATVTIVVNPVNDPPSISTDPGTVGGVNDEVSESGLDEGSNP